MRKAIHVSIIIVILVAILFTALMLILKYDEKGETNMPFEVSKISIISSIDGKNVEDEKYLWNKSVEQNNDIYIYIEKNPNYKKTETIKNILINNFRIIKQPQKGAITIYRPSEDEKEMFENKENYKTQEISYTGDLKTDMKALKISNQGGIISFRCATENISNYISNDNEINYDDLLKKTNVKIDEISAKISFDIYIILENNKQFKTTVEIDIPIEDVIEKGKGSIEKTDLDLVFKRIEN